MKNHLVVFGLGSNVGDRAAQLQKAVTELRTYFTQVYASPIYECHALLPEGAPKEWNKPFYNMAVRAETMRDAHQVLSDMQGLELSLGRIDRGHWGPREIDIDILAYDEAVIQEPSLIIPHAGLLERDFALIPFADVAPDWTYPIKGPAYGKRARDLASALHSTLVKTSASVT